ncbi:DUF4232 domain-containing protein [Tomitella gaofuii]|uniref:DUF4232 domain-containing protein n=1 Tax=Tomitella gaofuii TaxID=2760083 RepID=UPI0015FAE48E|nr:DUF4232 domain-containing protein [Tomitella gaofuii]
MRRPARHSAPTGTAPRTAWRAARERGIQVCPHRPRRRRRGCIRALGVGALALAAAATLTGCESAITDPSAQETTVPSLQARATPPSRAERTPQAIPTPVTTPSAAPTPASPPPAVPPASPPAGPSSAAPAPACPADALDVGFGRVGAAAGSIILTLVFTNTSSGPCTLFGYPGVSYVGADGVTQVGSAAVRSPRTEQTVLLKPGQSASSQVRAANVQNYPVEECEPTPVSGLRVYPPGDTGSVVLPHATTGCATTSPRVTQLDVTPVVPGTGD